MPDAEAALSHNELIRRLIYNPFTGAFRWRAHKQPGFVGTLAGYIDPEGYRRIPLNGYPFFAHRLAWFYAHGCWPTPRTDHRNGVRDDCRLSNLREATHAQNSTNRITTAKSGHLGVVWIAAKKKWRAVITQNGERVYLGCFSDILDAVHARQVAEIELHKEFSATLSRSKGLLMAKTAVKPILTKPFPEPGDIDPNTGIGKAIIKAESISKFAKAVGVSHQAASRWNARGFVPSGRVEQISQLYDVPKAELLNPKLAALLS